MEKKSSGLATAGLVLGIIALVGCWIPYINVVSMIIAVIGFILAIVALIGYFNKKHTSIIVTSIAIILCLLSGVWAWNVNSKTTGALKDGLGIVNKSDIPTGNVLTWNQYERIMNFGDPNESFNFDKLKVSTIAELESVIGYKPEITELKKETWGGSNKVISFVVKKANGGEGTLTINLDGDNLSGYSSSML